MRAICVLTILLCLLVGAVQSQQKVEIRVGPNVLVDRQREGSSGELMLAVDPTNPRNLFGGGILFSTNNSSGKQETRGYLSRDGGATWRTVIFPEAVLMEGGDPQVAYGKNGTVFFMTLTGGEGRKTLFYRSEDAGLSWERPIGLTWVDHPQIIVDHTNGAFAGTIYISGLIFAEHGPRDYHIVMFRSGDDGRTWTGPTVVATNHGLPDRGINTTSPAIFSDGELFVPYRDFPIIGNVRKPSGTWYVSTRDGGKTYSAPRRASQVSGAEIWRPFNVQVFFAADNSKGRFRDRLYAIWADRDYRRPVGYTDGVAGGKRARMVFSYSLDRGSTWSEPKMITPGEPEIRDQFQDPSIAVNKDGFVAVTWSDSRDTPAGAKNVLDNRYVSVSTDGGETFLPPKKISSGSCDFEQALANPAGGTSQTVFPGELNRVFLMPAAAGHSEYLGFAADRDGVFHHLWFDCRTGRNQIWTAPIRVERAEGLESKNLDLIDADITGMVEAFFDPLLEFAPAGTVELPIRLRNKSDQPVYGPITVEVTSSPHRPTRLNVLNSANHKTAVGATFDYSRALGDFGSLAPGAVTEAVVWRMKSPTTRLENPAFPFKVLGKIARPKIPIIKSTSEQVSYQEGDAMHDGGWRLDPRRNPDVLEVDLVNGKPRPVTFITDVDSITFRVEEGKSYDFAIQRDHTYHFTRVVGKRFTPRLESVRVGNVEDAKPVLYGPALDLEGGGLLADGSLQHTIDLVRGCSDCDAKLDVVELTAERSQSMWQRINSMKGVNSVETILITAPEVANLDEVVNAVSKAEVVFFDGGEQCAYVRNIRGSRVEQVIKEIYKRGGGVGGTSAGLAIQGDNVYDACFGTVTSVDALADPYHKKLSFTGDFFDWQDLANTITDTHVVKRDRMGRTFAFIARRLKDRKTKKAFSVALDEGAGVAIDKHGLATAFGPTNSYFILGDHQPEVCEPGKPLTFSNFKVWKILPGQTLNLRQRPRTGYYTVSVNQGKLSSEPY